MSKVRILMMNAIVLVISSVLMRAAGMWFQIYLSGRAGAEAVGLYQLVMSVYFVGLSLSVVGVRLASVRLCAEEAGAGSPRSARRAVRLCAGYAFGCAVAAGSVLILFADTIAQTLLGGADGAALSLRILAASLPLTAVAAALNGYFTARHQALHTSGAQGAELLVRIGVTAACLGMLAGGQGAPDPARVCAVIAGGYLAGECGSLFVLYVLWRRGERGALGGGVSPKRALGGRLLKIALPVTFSAMITTSLRSVQSLLVPHALQGSGMSVHGALSVYGKIHAMTLPVLLFPSIFLDAAADLMIPELAECRVRGSMRRYRYIINRVFKLGIILSVFFMFLFIKFADELSMALYKTGEIAFYIRATAVLIPLFYLDMLADAVLKGSDQQMSAMRYNITESFFSIVLIAFAVPVFGTMGYLAALFLGRGLNFSLSLWKVHSHLSGRQTVGTLLKSVFSIFAALTASNYLYALLPPGAASLGLMPVCIGGIYIVLLRLTRCVTGEDVQWLWDAVRGAPGAGGGKAGFSANAVE